GEQNYGAMLNNQIQKGPLKLAVGGDYNYYELGNGRWAGPGRNFGQLPGQSDGSMIPWRSWRLHEFSLFGEVMYEFLRNHNLFASEKLSYDAATAKYYSAPKVGYLGNHSTYYWKAFYSQAFRAPIPAEVLPNEEFQDSSYPGGWYQRFPGLHE